MQLQENFSLKQYNTFQVEAKALFFIEVHSIEELKEALHFSKEKHSQSDSWRREQHASN